LLLGIGIAYYFYYDTFLKNKTADSEILLKSIKQVAKMVTVEADFENIVNHKDFIKYDFYPLRKKAILKVKATVAAGCNLEKLNFTIDTENRTLTILKFPKSEILSIETDVEYYNMQEGLFNTFSEQELTELNSKAKEDIRIEASKSDLLKQADQRALEMFEIIKLIAENAGFLVIDQTKVNYYSTINL